MSQTSLWFIGLNAENECGEMFRNMQNADFGSSGMSKLTKCEWFEKLDHVTNIIASNKFNIISTATKDDEYVVFGFVRQCQNLLPHTVNTFYIIPASITLVCLDFFGNNYNKYWCIGLNDYGQCAVGHKDILHDITEINALHNIHKICSGNCAYSLFWITNNGEIYVNGANDRKQLGIKDGIQAITIPILSTFCEQNELKCIDAASSENYNMIVGHDGTVWSAGEAGFGQNGHGDILLKSDSFIKITALEKQNIINVSISAYFALFLEDNGNVWSCGYNEAGALGLEHCVHDSSRLPTKIEFFNRNNINITKIECGRSHSIALSEGGQVWCWGDNDYGQCAEGTVDNHRVNLHTPTLMSSFAMQVIIDMKCGRYHNGAVSKDRQFYLWGANDYNQCCLIDDAIEKIFEPYCIDQYVLQVTKSKHIIDIYLAYDVTMVLVK